MLGEGAVDLQEIGRDLGDLYEFDKDVGGVLVVSELKQVTVDNLAESFKELGLCKGLYEALQGVGASAVKRHLQKAGVLPLLAFLEFFLCVALGYVEHADESHLLLCLKLQKQLLAEIITVLVYEQLCKLGLDFFHKCLNKGWVLPL